MIRKLYIFLISESHIQCARPTGKKSHLEKLRHSSCLQCILWTQGGSVAQWLACWTEAQKDPGSNRSRDAVG